MQLHDGVWIFCGPKAAFPSGVFTTQVLAEAWISKHQLTGTLTWYPVDEGAYDWCVRSGLFTPKRDEQRTPGYIATFSSASQRHFHYKGGEGDKE
jgi:hypothetical protein